ncbi:MAG: HAD-IC family P-type ATPase [Oscillospiraceae bacterium]
MPKLIDINKGLSLKDVNDRISKKLTNKIVNVKTKSIKSIISKNLFTLFNFINFFLAILILTAGSYKNVTFIFVVFFNILISIIQELRSKYYIDKLKLLNQPTINVLRNSEIFNINIENIVKDDIVILSSENQVPADGIIVDGICEINESLITGESKSITKKINDKVLSGSFITSGKAKICVTKVGQDNYINTITNNLKSIKKSKSQILSSIKTIIKFISFIIFPIGILMFLKQISISNDYSVAITSTVAASIGMIPEGLVLLSSISMAIGIIKLSKHKALVKDLYSIENLSRVDLLCLDKTGTITTGKMNVDDIISLNNNIDCKKYLLLMTTFLKGNNSTSDAIKDHLSNYCKINDISVKSSVEFSSDRKFSSISVKNGKTYVLGAYHTVIKNVNKDVENLINQYLEKGKRVLTLSESNYEINNKNLPNDLIPIGVIIIDEKIRDNVKETIDYFYNQNVNIKIISGDDPISVSKIANTVGIRDSSKFIDASLTTTDNLIKCAHKYSVFGRVTPFQKLELIKTFKLSGNTVAMAGDGVNDTLALKESDCGIAIAQGSEAARNVSDIVLLDSNFNIMPKIVEEGRCIINNIEMSASLFITKTIYSVILAFSFLLLDLSYPFIPIQMTLISSLCIGIPSFFITLMPNYKIVRPRFLKNILKYALPGGLSISFNIILISIISIFLNITNNNFLIALYLTSTATGSFCVLNDIFKPYNMYKKVLFISLISLFILSVLYFPDFFSIANITLPIVVLSVLFLIPIYFFRKLGKFILYSNKKRKKFII